MGHELFVAYISIVYAANYTASDLRRYAAGSPTKNVIHVGSFWPTARPQNVLTNHGSLERHPRCWLFLTYQILVATFDQIRMKFWVLSAMIPPSTHTLIHTYRIPAHFKRPQTPFSSAARNAN